MGEPTPPPAPAAPRLVLSVINVFMRASGVSSCDGGSPGFSAGSRSASPLSERMLTGLGLPLARNIAFEMWEEENGEWGKRGSLTDTVSKKNFCTLCNVQFFELFRALCEICKVCTHMRAFCFFKMRNCELDEAEFTF